MTGLDPSALDPRTLDLKSVGVVERVLLAGAEANRSASCRHGSVDRIEPPGKLIATGDLHDNPLHFARLVEHAGLSPDQSAAERCHLVLHEVIHPDTLMNGMDFSYRALARVAALKAAHPELVHVLLANHELSQIVGAGIVKDGVRVVEAFNAGVEYVFGEDSPRVTEAIRVFVRSMPIALRCVTPSGDLLVAHSVPGLAAMNRFDASILSRDLTEEDYEPRRGAAHLMVWGRGYDDEQLEDLVERWGVNLFVLGHEKVPEGARLIPPNAIVLNSDHERGMYLPLDLADLPTPEQALAMARPLAQ